MKQKALKRPRRGGEASAGAPAPGLDPRSRRYSPEQRRAAVEAFERSGLTQREFARNFGVSVPSLGNWLKAFRARGARGLEHVGPGEPKRRGRRPMPKAKREAIEETKRRFPALNELAHATGLERVAKTCVGMDGRQVRKVVLSALASDKHIALDPRKLTLDTLARGAQRAADELRRRKDASK